MTTGAPIPEYVEDGRPCQIVTVADLLPGDVILGWQGEPWDFGTVASVERTPRPSFSGEVSWQYTIHMADDVPAQHWQRGDSWRRIAERES